METRNITIKNMSKFHQILFTSDMVEGILKGIKTQTRRKANFDTDCTRIEKYMDKWQEVYNASGDPKKAWISFCNQHSPFGDVGDILWVRETWQALRFFYDWETGYCEEYEVVDDKVVAKYNINNWWSFQPRYGFVYRAESGWDDNIEDRGFKWRPSIHMPKAACRLFLEITDVRVERLNDISEEDARSEGVLHYEDEHDDFKSYVESFEKLLQQL
jgi:hypothetical protein